MFLFMQLKQSTLDYGQLSYSPLHVILLILLILAIPMIPYTWMYFVYGRDKTQKPRQHSPFHKMMDWMHVHRHPVFHH